MWSVAILCIVVALVSIAITQWIHKWRNPKCNGTLPPGSMGLPLIGETLHLLSPSNSIDLHPFIKKRVQRYGPIFRTSLGGRTVVVSADPKFNHSIILQEGKSVEMWYLDTFSKLFEQDGEFRTTAVGAVHKYGRSLLLNHFGSEPLKEKLLAQLEQIICKTMHTWSCQTSIEVKHAVSTMVFEFTAKHLFGYDFEKSSEKISENLTYLLKGLVTFPLNIPGTTYHKCLKEGNKVISMIKEKIKEKQDSPETCRGDLLDEAVKDMNTHTFLKEDIIVGFVFGSLFASFESISTAITLAFKFLSENPSVVEDLKSEHETILKNRRNSNSMLTWDEYKSMTFTVQVVNEILRLGNVAPGLLRRTLKDIQVNGYTIPAGWAMLLVTPAHHLNPNTFNDPLAFNPWRWKDYDSVTITKNFNPFGGGIRQCAGAEYSKVFMSTFLHVLVTKYRWTKIKGGEVGRKPFLHFEYGIHIKVSEKDD